MISIQSRAYIFQRVYLASVFANAYASLWPGLASFHQRARESKGRRNVKVERAEARKFCKFGALQERQVWLSQFSRLPPAPSKFFLPPFSRALYSSQIKIPLRGRLAASLSIWPSVCT